MKDVFKNLHLDPSSWVAVSQLLDAGAQDCPATEWRPDLLQPTGEHPLDEAQHLRDAYFRSFEPHARDWLMACSDRYLSAAWPEMHPAVAFWARTSSFQAAQFASALCPLSGGSHMTIFPFPATSPGDLAFWLSTEWWMLAGNEFFLSRVCSDEAIFARHYDR